MTQPNLLITVLYGVLYSVAVVVTCASAGLMLGIDPRPVIFGGVIGAVVDIIMQALRKSE